MGGGGGGGCPGLMARKQSGQHLFLVVLNLFYSLQRGSNGNLFYSLQGVWGVQWFYYSENYFSKGPEGVQHFPGGGVQMLISIETHITYDFPGGGGHPPPFGSAHGDESPPPGENS